MKLTKGMNIGGYLSQCIHTPEHYMTFIVEDDIKKISEWGFDHVRLPVDYEVIEDEIGNAKVDGYKIIDKIVSWCKTYNLNIIIDLHKAFGYDFNNAGNISENNLFHSKSLQNRFISLWKTIAKAYGNCNNVAFELLNEVVEDENADAWNSLIEKTVNAIREIAPESPIIYGGIQWNSAQTMKFLKKPKHNNIIFTFHFYEPLLFTHQKAYWVKTINKTKDIFYPDDMELYKAESALIGAQGQPTVNSDVQTMGAEFMEKIILDAIKTAKEYGVELYCGEFGVIDRAPEKDTVRWFKDISSIFKKHHIGFSLWTYKNKDFGITNEHYDNVRDEILKTLTDC